MYDKFKFISGSLYSLISKVNLEIPTITLISKIDLIKSYGETTLTLEQFTSSEDLTLLKQWFK